MYLRYLKSILIITLIVSCSKSNDYSYNLNELNLTKNDSLVLFDSSRNFMFYDVIDFENTFGYNYPLLDLTFIKEGVFIHITEAGSGPGELNGLLKAVKTESNETIVLTEMNDSKILLFDSTFLFKNEINLRRILENYLPATTKSCLHVQKNNKSEYEIFFSLQSLRYSQFENRGFYEGYGVVKLIIDQNFEKVIDKSLHLNYADLPFFQKALEKNRKNWKYNSPHLSIKNGRVFVLYDSNPVLYEYDMDFNLTKEYPLALEFPSYNYSIPFEEIYDTQKRLFEEDKLLYSNYSFLQMEQSENYVYVTLAKPIEPEVIPEKDAYLIKKEYFIHRININNGVQSIGKLPKDVSAFNLKVKSDDLIYLIGTIQENPEDYYLYSVLVDELKK